jgi:NTE family protein
VRSPWRTKLGIALGGGAARGLAHVGVLRALHREGITVDIVTGASMGAIIGGAFAASGDIEAVERGVRRVLCSEQFRKNRLSFLRETRASRGGLLYSVTNLVRRGIIYGTSTMRQSFLSAEEFAHSMAAILPNRNIEDLPLPFAAVAVDLRAGEEVVLRRGNLRHAAAASSAIPGILPPVRHNGRVMVDGGWVDKVPVLPAFRLGADVVVAVDISADLEDTRDYTRGIDVYIRANAIKDAFLVSYQRHMADVVVEPAVRKVHWADFGAMEHCIAAGDEAATGAAPAIREALRSERWRAVVRPSPGRRMAEHLLESDDFRVRVE